MRDSFHVEPRQNDIWQSNPPFDRRHLRAIELALRKAWNELHEDPGTAQELSVRNEVRISHLLRDRLNLIRERETGGVEGYNCETFERPHIGAEMETPDGKVRKPDIVFGLCGKRRPGVTNGITDCIFAECKLIDQNKNVRLYCKEGVHRFVTGAYAAWMRESMMVAYVRSSQILPGALEKATQDAEIQTLLASNGQLQKCTLSRVEPRIYISVHDRNWFYPNSADRPGPIQVRHLWLYV